MPNTRPYHLAHLYVSGFRHYTGLEVDFSPGLNGIVGANGSGKTSVLDALHYVLTARSAVVRQEGALIGKGGEGFGLSARVCLGEADTHQLHVRYDGNKKSRTIQVDEQHYASRAAYLGRFPVLFMCPDDVHIVGSSEARRRFFDPLVAGMHSGYLAELLSYYRYLKRRQALLKSYLQTGASPDHDLLDSYDESLKKLAQSIYEYRKAFIKAFAPYFTQAYAWIAPKGEKASLSYESALENANWRQHYDQSRSIDVLRATTHIGIHKDDYLFCIQGSPVRTHASRGQIKSYVLALQIGYYHQYTQSKHLYPILLIDDLMDTLDSVRIQQLLRLLTQPDSPHSNLLPQLFITTQQMPTFQALLKDISMPTQWFQIHNQRIHVS